MTEGLGKILPCLKPADWDGTERNVSRRLWGEPSSWVPRLAFGYDSEHSFEFLPKERAAELGKSARDVEREAVRNLGLRPAVWERTPVKLGFFKKMTLLVSAGDYLSAEKILDVGFLREAEKQLKAELLAVGIPRRGFIAATDGKQPMERLGLFASAISTQYHRGETAPITPAIFAVSGGQIVGMLQGGEELGRAAAEEELREAEESGDAPYVGGTVVADEDGSQSVRLIVGGQNLERLADAIQGAFVSTLREHLPQKEFGGAIHVVAIQEMTPEPVRAALRDLVQHMNAFLGERQMKTESGRAVRVVYEEKGGGLTGA